MNEAVASSLNKSQAPRILSNKKPVLTTVWLVMIFLLVFAVEAMAKDHSSTSLLLAGLCGLLLGGGLRNFLDEWRQA